MIFVVKMRSLYSVMKKPLISLLSLAAAFCFARAQEPVEATPEPVLLTLEQAIQTALSENASVRIADLEIERTGYARKGSYAALFPQIDGSGSYQRTIKKQVMYMDFDIGGMGGGAQEGAAPSRDGFEVGRWSTWTSTCQLSEAVAAVTKAAPRVHATASR